MVLEVSVVEIELNYVSPSTKLYKDIFCAVNVDGNVLNLFIDGTKVNE